LVVDRARSATYTEVVTQPEPAPIYANTVRIATGAYDVLMEFGYRAPDTTGPEDFTVLTRVVMSPAHAKSMIPLLARMIADYETKLGGAIPAPGFENPPSAQE